MRAVPADQGLQKELELKRSAEEVIACFRKASDLMWPLPMMGWEAAIIGKETIEVKIK